jgi:molecular chaperone HtpG
VNHVRGETFRENCLSLASDFPAQHQGLAGCTYRNAEEDIYDYLAQVAPVPFSPEFKYRNDIESKLGPHVLLGNLEIIVSGIASPVYRPHRNAFEIRTGIADHFSELEFIEVPNDQNNIAVVGWILHHAYMGAIPPRSGIGGLRFRCGNIQVGTSSILEDVFPETRFNAWSVGEFHVLDPQLMPNGRRDHFEQNVHFHNVVNRVSTVARSITNLARISSVRRICMRDLKIQQESAREKIAVIKQGSLGRSERDRFAHDVRKCLEQMDRLAQRNVLTEEERRSAQNDISKLRSELERVLDAAPISTSLSKLSKGKRETYQSVFAMIYEYLPNQATAKSVVEKILRRIG